MSVSAKATLVATIGTRDLMFQTRSGDWFNIGDDQMQDDLIAEQAEVLSDLSLEMQSFRSLTGFLWQHWGEYADRIRPVILGKLLAERAREIGTVHLIGTDQPIEVPQRRKDSCYACELLGAWLRRHYPQIQVNQVRLGQDGVNPSDFEAMFRWWRGQWPQLVRPLTGGPVWLCNKGGVGQTSEAARISGLSRYGDRIQFFDFTRLPQGNRRGQPSDYLGPFLGTAYLWDRVQQQSLQLLGRYDYAEIDRLLRPYYEQDGAGFGAVPGLLRAGQLWNQGQFDKFIQQVRSIKGMLTGERQQRRQTWWWQAYEQGYLSVVRLDQGYTTEAMLLSFRAVEGCIWEWLEAHYPDCISHPPQRYPQLWRSICDRIPDSLQLAALFFNHHTQEYRESVSLNGYVQQRVLEGAIPALSQDLNFQAFWGEESRSQRNVLSHRLGGLSERDLFRAWGADIRSREDWEGRLLGCLNLLTQQSFRSLAQASLLTMVQQQLADAIGQYQP